MSGNAPAGKTNQGCGAQAIGLLFTLGGAALIVYTLGPARSSLSKDDFIFRVAMSLVIAGIGITFLLLAPKSSRGRNVVSISVPAEKDPAEPWLGRDDWAQGYARSESKSQGRTMGFAGALCLLLSVPLVIQLRVEILEKGRYVGLAGLVFPIVGLFMAGQSLLLYLRRRKFRDLRFELSTVPGTLGGNLTGRIAGQYLLPGGTTVELALSCVHSYAGRDSDRTQWQRVLWQDKRTATAQTGGRDSYIPVDFRIPYDVRETDNGNPDNEILWRLTAHANLPGVDFLSTFIAPVFKTPASDPALTTAKLDTENQNRWSGQIPAGAQISAAPAPSGGTQFYLAPARNKTAAAALTVFGLLSVGSGSFFGYLLQQWLGWIAGLVPLIIFGGLGVLLLVISASLWLTATTVELLDRELRIRTSWLGLSRSRVIHRADIRRLELHSGMQQGDRVWYDLRVHLANGRKVNAGSNMNREEADWLVGEIRRELGIPEDEGT